MERLLDSFRGFMEGFAVMVHGRNERYPDVDIQSTLTFARQACGWSGKYMRDHLQRARDWAVVAAAAEAALEDVEEELGFSYDGVELDSPELRPLIQDFLDHAAWVLQGKGTDRTVPGLGLRDLAGKFLKKRNIYTDRVGAARHYLGLYGAEWRAHIRSIA